MQLNIVKLSNFADDLPILTFFENKRANEANLKYLLFTLVMIVTLSLKAEQTHIAVASNFAKPMKALIETFENETNHTVEVSFASSGKLYSQIRNGAPFHLFFSADNEKPKQLIIDNLANTDTEFTYAMGQLVLWSNDPQLIKGRDTLFTEDFYKIAFANPKLAPFGVAAQQTIESLKLTSQLAPKIVRAENVAQTYQFISSGNAELGFIAMGQVFEDNHLLKGSVWVIPPSLYEPIQQNGVLLTLAKNNRAAHAFMLFVQSDEAKHIIQRFGFQTE